MSEGAPHTARHRGNVDAFVRGRRDRLGGRTRFSCPYNLERLKNAWRLGYQLMDKAILEGVRHCRTCGCTDEHGCVGGCAWVESGDDLCTRCFKPAGDEQEL